MGVLCVLSGTFVDIIWTLLYDGAGAYSGGISNERQEIIGKSLI